jgi:hypothetical protein
MGSLRESTDRKEPTNSQPTATVSTSTAGEPQTSSAQPTPPVFYTVAEVLEPNILKLKDGPTVSLIDVSCPIDHTVSNMNWPSLRGTAHLLTFQWETNNNVTDVKRQTA